jgi:hypothetical protein
VNAVSALEEMPPRIDEELDPVTLHNQALLRMDSKPTEGFEKLQFLLQQEEFPPDTFANLLLLLIKYQVKSNTRNSKMVANRTGVEMETAIVLNMCHLLDYFAVSVKL